MAEPEQPGAAITNLSQGTLANWWNEITAANDRIDATNQEILQEVKKNTNPASVFTENESYRIGSPPGRAIKVEEVYAYGWIKATYVQGPPGEVIYFNARTIDQIRPTYSP